MKKTYFEGYYTVNIKGKEPKKLFLKSMQAKALMELAQSNELDIESVEYNLSATPCNCAECCGIPF